MATVERRQQTTAEGQPGRVSYRVRWRDPSGKQKSETFTKRRAADRRATEVEHQTLTGSYVDPKAGRITLRSYANEWLASQVGAPGTRQARKDAFELHIFPTFGDQPIASIRPSDVQAWIAGLALGPRASVNTVSKLSSMFGAAISDRVVVENPCLGRKLPKVPKRLVVPPTPDAVGKLAVAMPDEWRLFVALGSGLGLRPGEALGLTVDRVDFLGRQVLVDRQSRRTRGEPLAFGPLKTEASTRILPLPDSVGKAISAHIASQGTGDEGLLIHSATGNHQSNQRLSDMMSAACTRAKIPALRAHDLRHFYASLLIAQGASVKTVQARLGHATAAETLDTYGHLWPDNEEQTRAAIDNVLGMVAYRWPEVG